MKKSFIFALSLLLLLCSCEASPRTEASVPNIDFSVTVLTEGGMALSNTEFRVYDAVNTDDLVFAGYTDKEGKIPLNNVKDTEYILELRELPDGHVLPENCKISSQNNVVRLDAVMGDPGDMSEYTCQLGSITRDFTITDVKGNEYRISELLKTKKAIVLNFWFINCGPCKMEFPDLQQAYEDYKEDLIVLAINPMDGNQSTISQYADELGLTFPVAQGDPAWGKCMSVAGYPTTVVIDRYGMISMRHTGGIPDKETFTRIFNYYTSDDYVQSVISSINDIQ